MPWINDSSLSPSTEAPVPIYTPPLFKWRSLICQFDKTEEQIKQKRKKRGYILTAIFSDSRPPCLPHHYWPSGLEYKYWPFHPKNITKTAKQVYNNKCYSYLYPKSGMDEWRFIIGTQTNFVLSTIRLVNR